MPRKMLNGADLVGQRVVNLGDPSAATDAANKQYVDNLVAGLSFKDEVRVATTGNGTLATAFANSQTIDGQVLATGNRILIKDQTTQSENGIYVVQASGAPVRATDADSTAELNSATVLVLDGTVNAGRLYTQSTKNPVVGTNPLVFAQFASGVSYTAGNGISLASNIITAIAKAAGGLAVDSGGIYIDVTQLAALGITRKYAAAVTANATQTITHNLNTLDVQVEVITVTGGEIVEPDITITGVNTIQVVFASAPTAGQYRVVVVG